ncbi:hypothetical protein [Paracoccus aminovorans]|uniref:hypothetical protein n=1 Tax=Paracoccus aminovorans TaxID=34004 RepID=UPI002B2609B3|nr:hypothetical protein [Paracoccus aminovorans]
MSLLVADLGRERLPFRFGRSRQPTVARVVRAGAGVITFCGDTLLNGPQAGVIHGRRELIARIRPNLMSGCRAPTRSGRRRPIFDS